MPQASVSSSTPHLPILLLLEVFRGPLKSLLSHLFSLLFLISSVFKFIFISSQIIST